MPPLTFVLYSSKHGHSDTFLGVEIQSSNPAHVAYGHPFVDTYLCSTSEIRTRRASINANVEVHRVRTTRSASSLWSITGMAVACFPASVKRSPCNHSSPVHIPRRHYASAKNMNELNFVYPPRRNVTTHYRSE